MRGLQKRVRQIVRQFHSIDWYAVRIIPAGADDPLPPVPQTVEITPEDVDRAIAHWNSVMPNYAGLLEAEIEGQRDYD